MLFFVAIAAIAADIPHLMTPEEMQNVVNGEWISENGRFASNFEAPVIARKVHHRTKDFTEGNDLWISGAVGGRASVPPVSPDVERGRPHRVPPVSRPTVRQSSESTWKSAPFHEENIWWLNPAWWHPVYPPIEPVRPHKANAGQGEFEEENSQASAWRSAPIQEENKLWLDPAITQVIPFFVVATPTPRPKVNAGQGEFEEENYQASAWRSAPMQEENSLSDYLASGKYRGGLIVDYFPKEENDMNSQWKGESSVDAEENAVVPRKVYHAFENDMNSQWKGESSVDAEENTVVPRKVYHGLKDDMNSGWKGESSLEAEENVVIPRKVYHGLKNDQPAAKRSAWDKFCEFWRKAWEWITKPFRSVKTVSGPAKNSGETTTKRVKTYLLKEANREEANKQEYNKPFPEFAD